jgi:hypothetical protein
MKIKPLEPVRTGSKSVIDYVKAVKDGQHVVPSDDGWKVKRAEASRATRVFESQKEAIDYARKIAIKQQSELSIHSKNGQIREKNSYEKDGFPPRG